MEWDAWLNQFFTAVKGITKLQHFHFSTDLDGQVSVHTSCNSVSKTIKVLKRGVKTSDLIAAPPPTLFLVQLE